MITMKATHLFELVYADEKALYSGLFTFCERRHSTVLKLSALLSLFLHMVRYFQLVYGCDDFVNIDEAWNFSTHIAGRRSWFIRTAVYKKQVILLIISATIAIQTATAAATTSI